MRLDKSIKKQILNKLIAYRFSDQCSELRRKVAGFAETVYNDVYSGFMRTQMHDLAEGWLPDSKLIKIQFGAEMVDIEYSGGCISGKVGWSAKDNRVTKRVPFKDYGSDEWYAKCVKVYDANDALSIKWATLTNEIDDLVDKIDEAEIHINTLLNTTTTTEGLIGKWPEVEPFLKDLNGYKHVPALPTEKLNKLLDLPVS